jgi:hypothetical protein
MQLQLDAPPSSLWFDLKGVDGVIGTSKGTRNSFIHGQHG